MEGNYSLRNLEARAATAREVHRNYISKLEQAYVSAGERREAQKIPPILIVGKGRSGKDTSAEFLAGLYNLPETKSASLIIAPLVASMVGLPEDVVYKDRHSKTDFWIKACHAIRGSDLPCLARWCLGTGDIVIGLRGKEEFVSVMQNRICELSVWIERNVPADYTVEFLRRDCDVVIENNEELSQLYRRLSNFGRICYKKR